MEQTPRLRDAIKDAARGAWRDATGEWREKAQIGDHVVLDCTLFGVSVWRRAEDGTIERLDPEDVAFSAREPEATEIPSLERRTDELAGEWRDRAVGSEWERPV